MKRQYGVRTYHNEDRNGNLQQTGVDNVKFQILCVQNTRTNLRAIVNANVTQDSSRLGVNTLDDTLYSYDIYQNIAKHHLRNVGNHAMFITIYEITPKHNEPITGHSSFNDMITDKIVNGWQSQTGAGASAPTSLTGDQIITSSGLSDINVKSAFMNPKDSHEFNKFFRITRQKKFKLKPGDDIWIYKRYRDRVYNPRYEETRGTVFEFYKNYTTALMVKMYGVLGQTTDGANEVGYVNTELAWECFHRCRVLPLKISDHVSDRTVTFDDLTAQGLEAPNEVADQPDEN